MAVQARQDNTKRESGPDMWMYWGTIMVLFLVYAGFRLIADKSGYAVNLFTEFLSISITIFVLDRRAQLREQKRLEAELMRRIRSSVRDVAVAAVEELKFLGYFDGDKTTFIRTNLSRVQWSGAFLLGVNLQGADLMYANLQDAYLEHVNLPGATLRGANLQGAYLVHANLQRANLVGANLSGADLALDNLQGAYLRGANLQGTNLMLANLQGASLDIANLDPNTVLPDGTPWTPDTDMARFTDPNHPGFWRSDRPYSPAYRGGGEPGGE
jgi:uncharacterized protein YjbI with pentapeptide repeats